MRAQPEHRLAEQADFVRRLGLAHGDRQIELAGLQRLREFGGTADAQFDPDPRMAGSEGSQQFRQAAVGEILRRTDGDAAIGARALQRQPCFAVDGEYTPGMADQILAGRRQAAPPPLREKQRLADDLLQPLHLRRHRRGRAADHRSCLRQRAAVDESEEGFEKVRIEYLHNSIISNYKLKTIRFF